MKESPTRGIKKMTTEFFDGFAWGIPKAFSDAVAACWFEEGDMLYDTQKAYNGDWGTAVKQIHHIIQIREPARGLSTIPKESGSVFKKNWASEVYFELQSLHDNSIPKYIRTTQGRLYSALWHGDLSIVDKDAPEPKLPLQLREVTKKLEQTVSFAKELAGANPVFVMARDLSNNISRIKHRKVKSALHSHYGASNHAFVPKKAGVKNWERVAPTIDVVFYIMKPAEHDDIHERLKSQLYVSAKEAKKDRFRLSTHGMLLAD